MSFCLSALRLSMIASFVALCVAPVVAAPAPITALVTLAPADCSSFGPSGGTQTYTAVVSSNAPSGTTFMYGWSSNFGLTISTPSSIVHDRAIDHDVTVGSRASATVTVAPQRAGLGEVGSIAVFLFRADPGSGTLVPVAPAAGTGVAGMQAGAFTTIESGADSCRH